MLIIIIIIILVRLSYASFMYSISCESNILESRLLIKSLCLFPPIQLLSYNSLSLDRPIQHTIVLCLHFSINMLLSSLKSPIVSSSLIPGFLILSALSELLFVMLNLSTNAFILLLTGLNLNLSEIVTIISSLIPKKNNIFRNWSLYHLIIHGASGKLSINS